MQYESSQSTKRNISEKKKKKYPLRLIKNFFAQVVETLVTNSCPSSAAITEPISLQQNAIQSGNLSIPEETFNWCLKKA